MTVPNSSQAGANAQCQSETEFPATVDALERDEANTLYIELREYLITMERRHTQLVQQNNQYKQALQEKIDRLKGLVTQLLLEKQKLIRENQQVLSDLEFEISSLAIPPNRSDGDQDSGQDQHQEADAEAWANFTLSSAMKGLENDFIEYTVTDLKETF